MDASRARAVWEIFEPFHALIYWVAEARAAYAGAGLKGGWMGYFASRAAAMGPVPGEVVVATFYNFHPRMVLRAIPDAWTYSSPARVLEARLEVARAALHRLLEGIDDADAVARALPIARAAIDSASMSGRPLFAAHASLPWPEEPVLALWHATTLLREHRGDGHVAALVDAGLDGCEANVTACATGAMPAGPQRDFRGWSADEWAAAEDRLRARGWLDPRGELTARGVEERARIEARTDEMAIGPWRAVGDADTDAFVRAMTPLSAAVVAGNGLPFPNPMGLTRARALG